MKIEINTIRYQASHTKQPRGRGLWLFEDRAGVVRVQHNGTYGEAAKVARSAPDLHGVSVLYVSP